MARTRNVESPAAFTRLGFRKELVSIVWGLSMDNPGTTYGNIASEFEMQYGVAGKGKDRAGFIEKVTEHRTSTKLERGLRASAALK